MNIDEILNDSYLGAIFETTWGAYNEIINLQLYKNHESGEYELYNYVIGSCGIDYMKNPDIYSKDFINVDDKFDNVFASEGTDEFDGDHEIEFTDEEAQFLKNLEISHNLYSFTSVDELNKIYKLFNEPIVDNYSDISLTIRTYNEFKFERGLIYIWSHWDEFDDHPMMYCGIFLGAGYK